VLVSGLYLAHECNLTPIIIWESNNWCGASFSELFDSNVLTLYGFDYATFFNQNPTLNIIHENQFHQPLESIHPGAFSHINEIKALVDEKKMNVFYYTNLMPSWVDMATVYERILPLIPFTKDIKEKAAKFLDQLPRNFHSIHRRKTDFAGISETSDDYFVNVVKNNPNKIFFVCSDDKQTELDFAKYNNVRVRDKASYVNKLVDGDWNTTIQDSTGNIFNFNVDRNSLSVQEAIVDLLILSNSYIVNKHSLSTFLHTATLLNDYSKHLKVN
jgi:hypothetical protein